MKRTTKPLTLNVRSDDEITLPAWIGATNLSLAEIGALAVILCLGTEFGEGAGERLKSPEMMKAVVGLKDKGLMDLTFENGAWHVKLDLNSLDPRQ